MRATTNHRQRLLDRGRGFKPRGKNFFTDGKRGHASRQKHENYGRHHHPAAGPQTRKRRKQTVRPRWGRREGPALDAAVLYFLFLGRAGRLLVCFSLCVLSLLCVCLFSTLFLYPGDHFSAKLKDMRGDVDQVADVRNRRANIFPPITLLKMVRTSNTRFGHSANALG